MRIQVAMTFFMVLILLTMNILRTAFLLAAASSLIRFFDSLYFDACEGADGFPTDVP